MTKIAPAFIAAKKAFSPALKDKTNPAFRSKYADLGACLEAVNDALLDNGIAVIQETFDCESGITVETVLLHESGETIRSGKLHVPAVKQDPQGYGSALTYARRYSLMAVCGIAPEDDDGNAASRAAAKPQKPAQSVPKDIWDTIDEPTKRRLEGVAEAVRKCLESDDMTQAIHIYGEVTDADEKTALWSRFDSKERSSIKKAAQQQKEQA